MIFRWWIGVSNAEWRAGLFRRIRKLGTEKHWGGNSAAGDDDDNKWWWLFRKNSEDDYDAVVLVGATKKSGHYSASSQAPGSERGVLWVFTCSLCETGRVHLDGVWLCCFCETFCADWKDWLQACNQLIARVLRKKFCSGKVEVLREVRYFINIYVKLFKHILNNIWNNNNLNLDELYKLRF